LNYIVDDIGKVVAAIRETWITADNTVISADNSVLTADGSKAPYYMYGHKLEVANRLLLKNKVFQKYPLFFLVMDFPERKANGIISVTLNIGIIHFTKKEYNAEQRMANVFKPILYPLYNRFLEELRNTGLFMWEGNQDEPEHTKIDRMFWGTGGEQNQTGQKKNEKNIFNDPLDIVELVDLKLNQTIKC
jgi:hypothetical protein